MTKPENTVLVIDPNTELKFEGPFTIPVLSIISLTSYTDKKILFKLKTTAPKKYCVRPNSGILYPKSRQEIHVCLQPFTFNANEKLKHKFMVQFVIEPEGERIMATDDIWKSIAPDKIMNYKLKCVFEQPALPGNDVTEQPPGSDVVLYPEPKAKKVVDVPSLMGNGGELQKVAAEVKQLREEESKLRQENIVLKEEISRLRQKSDKESERHTYSPPAYQIETTASGPIPMSYIVAALFIAIFSFLLGKFFN